MCIEGHLLRRWWCHSLKHSVYLQATSAVSYSNYLISYTSSFVRTLGEPAGPWRFIVSISLTSLERLPWSYLIEDHYHVFSVWRGMISLDQTEQRHSDFGVAPGEITSPWSQYCIKPATLLQGWIQQRMCVAVTVTLWLQWSSCGLIEILQLRRNVVTSRRAMAWISFYF